MEVIQVESAAAMDKVAEKLLQCALAQSVSGATVIALSGELGAGKTTLVQALARSLGIAEVVTSPTYVVMKSYELDKEALPLPLGGFTKLIHIDAYRIETLDEMRVLGFSKLLTEKSTMMCIEWPEHIAQLLPEGTIQVALAVAGDGREISIS